MKRAEYPAAVRALVAELKRMPGVGPRSAERIALWMIQSRDARPGEIARAIGVVTETVQACPRCGFFTTEALCDLCTDPARDSALICVVELPTDATTRSADAFPRWTTSAPTISASTPSSRGSKWKRPVRSFWLWEPTWKAKPPRTISPVCSANFPSPSPASPKACPPAAASNTPTNSHSAARCPGERASGSAAKTKGGRTPKSSPAREFLLPPCGR